MNSSNIRVLCFRSGVCRARTLSILELQLVSFPNRWTSYQNNCIYMDVLLEDDSGVLSVSVERAKSLAHECEYPVLLIDPEFSLSTVESVGFLYIASSISIFASVLDLRLKPIQCEQLRQMLLPMRAQRLPPPPPPSREYVFKQAEPVQTGEPQCITCTENRASICFAECGHQVMCDVCVKRMWDMDNHTCPVCRTKCVHLVRPCLAELAQ